MRRASSLLRAFSQSERLINPINESISSLPLPSYHAIKWINTSLPDRYSSHNAINKSQQRYFSSPTSNQSPPPPPPPRSEAPTIEIQDIQSFNSIIALSSKQPVVLDAYATWCGPCKQLDPLLKQIIASYNGAITLAKMDIDSINLAQLVQSLRITSVPTLFMLLGGRIVDVKQGVPPKQELQAWIAEAVRVAQQHNNKNGDSDSTASNNNNQQNTSFIDPKVALSEAFYALHSPDASSKEIAPLLSSVLEKDHTGEFKAAAMAGLAMCAVLDNQLDTAQELVDNAKASVANNTGDQSSSLPHEVVAAQATVDIALMGRDSNDSRTVDELQTALNTLNESGDKSNNNKQQILDILYSMALKLFMEKRHQEAIHTALLLIRKDREWKEQAGKRLVLLFCDALDQDSEVAKAGRKRLSNIWFL